MTTDHEHSAAVDLAGAWLARNPRSRFAEPIIRLIRQRFGLSVTEAVEACLVASKAREPAHGKP
jgi:hypothetical protein